MAKQELHKTAYYRVVDFISEESFTLSELLLEARGVYESDNPSFRCSDDFECTIVSHDIEDTLHKLHLVKFEEGANAAVIDSFSNESTTDIEEVSAPENMEFVKTHLFLICEGNEITWVSHNAPLREGSVKSLLLDLIKTVPSISADPEFFLNAPVNEAAFQKLIKDGIDSIDLDTTAFSEQLEYIQRNGKMRGTIGWFFRSDQIDDELKEAASKIKLRTSIKPGRNWGLPKVRVMLEDLSKNLISTSDDGEGFEILTKNGDKLTKERMTISRVINVNGNSQKLDVRQAFSQLTQKFQQMREAAK